MIVPYPVAIYDMLIRIAQNYSFGTEFEFCQSVHIFYCLLNACFGSTQCVFSRHMPPYLLLKYR